MPRIRRWFPISHDINSDPEVWELTDRFRTTGLRVWLEILSVADRNDGVFPGDYQYTVRALAVKCNSTKRQVSMILEFIQSKLWVSSEYPLRVRNYLIFHPSRGTNKFPSKETNVFPTSLTSLTNKNKNMIKGEIRPHASETQTPPSADKNHNKLTADKLVELYNTNKPEEWAKCQRITPERRKKLNLLLREWKDLDDWLKIFDNLNCSQWLRGLTGNPPFHSRHRTIDWLFSNGRNGISNALKIYEGKYNDPPPPPPTLAELYPPETDNPLARDPPILGVENVFQEKAP